MTKYVHGYTTREFERLEDQAGILEAILHDGTEYGEGEYVLEAGCGVGAQTVALCRRSPEARFVSIDLSEESLEQAKERMARSGCTNVEFQRASIKDLPFSDNSFNHVFVCFVLEHLDDPVAALKELKRVLRPGGSLTVIEGDHGSCFWHPETEESLITWNTMIQVQQRLGHDPNIGRTLYPLLSRAGFDVSWVEPRYVYADAGKKEMLDGMVNKIIVPMTQTARASALSSGLTDAGTWRQGIMDLEASGCPSEGTFFYTWFKALATRL